MNPRVKSVASQMGPAIVARIFPGTDLVGGVEKICQQHKVNCGTVISGIGSLQHAMFVYAVAVANAPVGAAYDPPRKVAGPIELLSLQGTIGVTEEDEISIHLHGMLVDPHQQVCGGHLLPNHNPVLATVEIVVCATPDVKLVRSRDRETGFELFNPVAMSQSR